MVALDQQLGAGQSKACLRASLAKSLDRQLVPITLIAFASYILRLPQSPLSTAGYHVSKLL
eukprot:scaffold409576_cov15-Prasinocladus_malaysianus.AAC.1